MKPVKMKKCPRCIRKRRIKNAIHVVTLIAICLSLLAEGAKHADWLFFAMSIITEVS